MIAKFVVNDGKEFNSEVDYLKHEEEEFFTCRARYDYAMNQNDVLGRLRIIRETSSVLFDAVAKGESDVKMDEWVDELIHSVNKLKKVVQIKK